MCDTVNKEKLKEYNRRYNAANKEKLKEGHKQYYITRKAKACVVLGGLVCAECGRLDGLTIAHIGELRGERRIIAAALYNWIISNPEEAIKKVRILCANCNHLERGADGAGAGVQRHREAIGRLGGVCVWCEETDIRVLTKDHIHDDGATDPRSSYQISKYIIEGDLEEILETFQCLCHACQLEKERERRQTDDLGIPILKSGEDM